MSWAHQLWGAFQPLQCGTTVPAQWEAAFRELQTAAPPWSKELVYMLVAAACDVKLRPATLIAVLLSAAIAALVLAFKVLGRLMRWYTAKRGSTFVAIATGAAAELRTRDAAHFPPTPHVWYTQRSVGAPVVCAVCYMPVILEGHTQCCECCGVVAHQKCARKVPHDCRPLALPNTEQQLHDWHPAGVLTCTLQLSRAPSGIGNGGMMDPQLCLYCLEPCEVGLFAVEPVWCCSCCQVSAHVQCYAHRHPHHFSAPMRAALESQSAAAASGGAPASLNGHSVQPPSPFSSSVSPVLGARTNSGAGGSGARGRAAARRGQASSGPRSGRSKTHVGVAGGGWTEPAADAPTDATQPWPVSVPMNGGGAAAAGSGAAAGRDTRGGSGGGGGSGDAAEAVGGLRGSSPGHRRYHSYPDLSAGLLADGGTDTAPGQQQSPPAASGSAAVVAAVAAATALGGAAGGLGERSALDSAPPLAAAGSSGTVLSLDVCTFGRHRQAVLPATSVHVVFDAPLLTVAQAAALLGPSPPPDGMLSASSSTTNLTGMGGGPGGGGGGSKARRKAGGKKANKASWWQRREPVRFRDHRIGKLPLGCRPLLVFVNLKSGPQAGSTIKRQLLQLLHPLQVVELPREKPEAALRCFAYVPGLRVLVVGGDGTAGWVLQCLDALTIQLNAPVVAANAAAGAAGGAARLWRPPPVAILPLGTGNDLARCLNWGSTLGEVMQRGLATVLSDVAHAAPTRLDRWNVHITSATKPRHGLLGRPASVHVEGASPPATPRLGGTSSDPPAPADDATPDAGDAPSVASADSAGVTALGVGKGGEVKVLNNYLGIGIDAKVALEFHQIRESYPTWFQSQVGNKMWYTGVGAKDLLGHSCGALHKRMQVVCDGVQLVLPPDAEGILILNIASFMGGVDAWAQGAPGPPQAFPPSRAAPRRQSQEDGFLEVVAVYGALHLGQLQVGVSQVTRLAQGSSIVVHTQQALPMQIDGEPWMQPPGSLQLAFKAQATMLRRLDSSPTAKFSHMVWEVLEHSEQRGVITAHQRHLLAAEMAARVEE